MTSFAFFAASTVIDFDPMHNTQLAQLFAGAHGFFAWMLSVYYLMKIAEDSLKLMMIMNNAHGVTVSNLRAGIKAASP